MTPEVSSPRPPCQLDHRPSLEVVTDSRLHFARLQSPAVVPDSSSRAGEEGGRQEVIGGRAQHSPCPSPPSLPVHLVTTLLLAMSSFLPAIRSSSSISPVSDMVVGGDPLIREHVRVRSKQPELFVATGSPSAFTSHAHSHAGGPGSGQPPRRWPAGLRPRFLVATELPVESLIADPVERISRG